MARAHRRVRRPRKPFVHAEGRFVAWPLRGVLTILNVYASMKGESAMKRGNCLMALGVAIAVNAAALMAVNSAMVDAAERELLSQQQPLHVVVITAKRQDLPANQTIASQNCPAPKAL